MSAMVHIAIMTFLGLHAHAARLHRTNVENFHDEQNDHISSVAVFETSEIAANGTNWSEVYDTTSAGVGAVVDVIGFINDPGLGSAGSALTSVAPLAAMAIGGPFGVVAGGALGLIGGLFGLFGDPGPSNQDILDAMAEGFDKVNKRLDRIGYILGDISQKLNSIQETLKAIQAKLLEIQVTLNEIQEVLARVRFDQLIEPFTDISKQYETASLWLTEAMRTNESDLWDRAKINIDQAFNATLASGVEFSRDRVRKVLVEYALALPKNAERRCKMVNLANQISATLVELLTIRILHLMKENFRPSTAVLNFEFNLFRDRMEGLNVVYSEFGAKSDALRFCDETLGMGDTWAIENVRIETQSNGKYTYRGTGMYLTDTTFGSEMSKQPRPWRITGESAGYWVGCYAATLEGFTYYDGQYCATQCSKLSPRVKYFASSNTGQLCHCFDTLGSRWEKRPDGECGVERAQWGYFKGGTSNRLAVYSNPAARDQAWHEELLGCIEEGPRWWYYFTQAGTSNRFDRAQFWGANNQNWDLTVGDCVRANKKEYMLPWSRQQRRHYGDTITIGKFLNYTDATKQGWYTRSTGGSFGPQHQSWRIVPL